MCSKYGKYGYRASDYLGEENTKKKKNKVKPRFNRECYNYVRKGHGEVDCLLKKKEKEDALYNFFLGDTLCGEVSEINND